MSIIDQCILPKFYVYRNHPSCRKESTMAIKRAYQAYLFQKFFLAYKRAKRTGAIQHLLSYKCKVSYQIDK